MGLIDAIGGGIKYLLYLAAIGVAAVFLFFVAMSLLVAAGQSQNNLVAGAFSVIGLGILAGLYLRFKK